MGNGQSYIPPTATDLDILARTLAGEAESEPLAGQFQVAFCILRRAALAAAFVAKKGRPHPLFGNGTILKACKTDWQFSCWNVGDPNYARINLLSMNDAAYRWGMYVALSATLGQQRAALPDATHYYNPKLVKATPAWVTGIPAKKIAAAKFDGTIGNHRFYSAVP